MPSPNALRYGSDAPLPARHTLRAGPLEVVYEAGDLRTIRLGGRELIRRIYVAVRDHEWNTVLPQLSNEQIEAGADTFRIRYDVVNQQGEIDITWSGEIAGEADGTIRFTMDGVARSTFLSSRVGFCVLHPASIGGAAARIEHVDGGAEEATLPRLIAQQQFANGHPEPVYPFAELRALAHEVEPGVWAELRFEGEIFELEDQRNWLDASFKTYGTPLRLPFPARFEAGRPIRQAVTLSLNEERGARNEERAPGEHFLSSFIVHRSSFSLPPLGLGVSSHEIPLAKLELLRALHLAHLRVDLHLWEAGYDDALARAGELARALGVQLEVALFVSDDADRELAILRATLEDLRPPVARWLVFQRDEKVTGNHYVDLARTLFLGYAPGAPFVSGTNVYFTELNRVRPDPAALDGLVYSVNPQVHAFDNASLAECPPMLAATVASARAFAGGKPIHISPITLRPRFNPNAVGPAAAPEADPRQASLFGACWTLSALKYLAEGGAASATLFETIGPRGVLDADTAFPLFHVLADVGEFAGGEVVVSQSSEPLAVEGLALRRGASTRFLLANLTNEPQRARLELPFARVAVRMLDERNALAAMTQPEAFRAEAGELMEVEGGALEIELLPYGVARLDAS